MPDDWKKDKSTFSTLFGPLYKLVNIFVRTPYDFHCYCNFVVFFYFFFIHAPIVHVHRLIFVKSHFWAFLLLFRLLAEFLNRSYVCFFSPHTSLLKCTIALACIIAIVCSRLLCAYWKLLLCARYFELHTISIGTKSFWSKSRIDLNDF